MTFVPIISALARRRLGAPTEDGAPLQRAARHGWLAVELTLAGPAAWDAAAAFAFPSHPALVRQQAETLLDQLSLAGLGIDDLGVQRRCREQMRLARQAGL